MQMTCNVCGGSRFSDMNGRKNVRCAECSSLERSRVIALFLDKHKVVRPGARVMHLAPERGIAAKIREVPGVLYEAYDIDPNLYKFMRVEKLDLVDGAEKLPSNHYDLIIHSHVVEHVPCNITAVFYHLHRSLKDTGLHIFSLPIYGDSYDECLGKIPEAERVRRFGQNDHVRRFSPGDLQNTLGMIFQLTPAYDLGEQFSIETLDRHNIPTTVRKGFNSNSVFCMQKGDLKLKP